MMNSFVRWAVKGIYTNRVWILCIAPTLMVVIFLLAFTTYQKNNVPEVETNTPGAKSTLSAETQLEQFLGAVNLPPFLVNFDVYVFNNVWIEETPGVLGKTKLNLLFREKYSETKTGEIKRIFSGLNTEDRSDGSFERSFTVLNGPTSDDVAVVNTSFYLLFLLPTLPTLGALWLIGLIFTYGLITVFIGILRYAYFGTPAKELYEDLS